MKDENIEQILNKLGTEDVPAEVSKIAEETSEQFSKTLTPSRQHTLWSNILRSRITKLAAAAVIIIAALLVINHFGGSIDVTSVAWGEVVKKVEQIGSFIFQQRISITSVADGTAIQEAELTTYVSSEYGLRQDTYMNGQVISISYVPLEGTIIIGVWPSRKKYVRVSTTEELMRKTHDQSNPKGMIKEFMSFEHTQLGRKIIDGVEAEGIEVNDPDFLSAVFESVVGRLWVDVETDLPLRTEIEGVSGNGSIETKIVAYDFDWDAEPEPSVFEPNIPDDYTLLEK